MEPHTSTEAVAHPHLQALLRDVAQTTTAAKALHESLSAEQLAWKPAPDVWNVLECFEHLLTTNSLYFVPIRKALAEAPQDEGEPVYRPSFFGRTFIGFIVPESKRKLKTLRPFEPTQGLNDVTVMTRFCDQQRELADLIRQADGLALNGKKRVISPASKLVRFTLGEALTLLVTHQRRHLQQAQHVTQHPGFPA